MKVEKKLLVGTLMVVIAFSIVVYTGANQPPSGVTDNPSDTDTLEFKAVVNEGRNVDVLVHVNISDGLTYEEAELIAEGTFIEVMGEEVMHRLDTVAFNDTEIEAHYTWGYNENDMGHVFDITADLTTLLITVTHCR